MAPASAAQAKKTVPTIVNVKKEASPTIVNIKKEASGDTAIKDENSNPQPSNKSKQKNSAPAKKKTVPIKKESTLKKQKKATAKKPPPVERNRSSRCPCGNCKQLLELCGAVRDGSTDDFKLFQYQVNVKNPRYRAIFYKTVANQSNTSSRAMPECVHNFVRKLFPDSC